MFHCLTLCVCVCVPVCVAGTLCPRAPLPPAYGRPGSIGATVGVLWGGWACLAGNPFPQLKGLSSPPVLGLSSDRAPPKPRQEQPSQPGTPCLTPGRLPPRPRPHGSHTSGPEQGPLMHSHSHSEKPLQGAFPTHRPGGQCYREARGLSLKRAPQTSTLLFFSK